MIAAHALVICRQATQAAPGAMLSELSPEFGVDA